MADIPDWPFKKIAIDLITDLNVYVRKPAHPHHYWPFTGWLDAFPILNKKVDTIAHVFINNYLPVHMCPRYTLFHNGTEFKNQLMDDVLQQCGINHIFSTPYHPLGNGNMDVFHKYLNPTLKKLCEKMTRTTGTNTSTRYSWVIT